MNVRKKVAAVVLMGLCSVGAVFANSTQDMSQLVKGQSLFEMDQVSSFTVEQGDTPQLLVSGSEEALEGFEVYMEDGVLVIEGDKKMELNVKLVSPSVDSLSVRDNSTGVIKGFEAEAFNLSVNRYSDVEVDGTLAVDQLTLYSGYASNLSLDINSEATDLFSSVSGNLNLTGHSDIVTGETMGMSTASLVDFDSNQFDLECSGDSIMNLDFSGETSGKVTGRAHGQINLDMDGEAKMRLNGDSELIYSGDVDWTSKIRIGSGTTVHKLNL